MNLKFNKNIVMNYKEIYNNSILELNLKKTKYEYIGNSNNCIYFKPSVYGIKNYEGYGNFNLGLQIITFCDVLVKELINNNYVKSLFIRALNDAIEKLNNAKIFDASSFCNFFMKNIPGFIENMENDSQS